MKRILVVDDSVALRGAVRALLTQEFPGAIVGEAAAEMVGDARADEMTDLAAEHADLLDETRRDELVLVVRHQKGSLDLGVEPPSRLDAGHAGGDCCNADRHRRAVTGDVTAGNRAACDGAGGTASSSITVAVSSTLPPAGPIAILSPSVRIMGASGSVMISFPGPAARAGLGVLDAGFRTSLTIVIDRASHTV